MKKETARIIRFIKKTLKEQGFNQTIIAVSGGVDSAVSLMLLTQAIGPKNILVIKLPYAKQNMDLADKIIKQAKIPTKNIININIAPMVKQIASTTNRLRLGNIMVRVRMILLYDLAKKHQTMVCGTENRSEYLLGYFTRYGDEAADFAPIRHLYKTQVYQLAEYLGIPRAIIDQSPTAGLWPGQTDEAEFGFTYQEADQVLKLYCDDQLSLEQIKNRGFNQAGKIIQRVKNNQFKHQTPYGLTDGL
ncbi:NAD+ synthase [Patescibacteria group bacterium]|nr:NAD+ synthase [Patescibacteria group bacterium]MBU1931804.1 NAD+ synthase [Patescibacteria group bacterium]